MFFSEELQGDIQAVAVTGEDPVLIVCPIYTDTFRQKAECIYKFRQQYSNSVVAAVGR